MDNQATNLPAVDGHATDQSGRRDFLKKMVLAGAFAAPVVATFARGARGSSTLRNELANSAGTPAVNSYEAQLLNSRGQAHFQNVAGSATVPPTTRAPIVTSNVTTAPTAAPTTAASTTTAAPATTTTDAGCSAVRAAARPKNTTTGR